MNRRDLAWRGLRGLHGLVSETSLVRWVQQRSVQVLERLDVTARARLHNGDVLYVDLAGRVGRSIWLRGRYDEDLVEFLYKDVQPSDVVIDVGANVGYYTAIAARKVGEEGLVVSVEPATAALGCLSRSVRENGWSNVLLCAVAASDRAGVTSFFPASDSALGRIGEGGPVAVPTARLDDIVLPALAGRSIAAVKLDVEGHELEALEGMVRIFELKPRRVLAEAHGSAGREWVSRLFAYFGDRGYVAVDPSAGAPLSVDLVMGGVWNVGFLLPDGEI